MKIILFILSFVVTLTIAGAEAQAASKSKTETIRSLMVEDSYEAPAGELFNEDAYFHNDTALSQYTNVIVINKAASGSGAQTLRLYTNRQLRLTTKVSTGAEDVEYVSPMQSFLRKFGKGTTQSHWRHTTRGFYTIKRIEGVNYASGENGFHMPYAMFFNEEHGLAIHQVPPDLKGGEQAGEWALGSRASSGCVRVSKNHILEIHDAVVSAGRGQIPVLDTKTGQPLLDKNGQIRYQNGYETIVIVEEL
jgi:lipoprotein-anchoring transpeptidase ErfK/SrfK